MLGFYFILVVSIIVTGATSFGGHRFKLEAEDCIFHISQRNLPNFGMKEGTQFVIKMPFLKKKKCSYLNNNSLSVYVLEKLFPSLKEGKNCKIFLVL